jgi:hypothetical protein
MTLERIEKAVEVIEYAIKHNISVLDASVKCGYANTYVKNIKRLLLEKYKAGTLEDELYDKFMTAYERYCSSQVSDSTIPEVKNSQSKQPEQVKTTQTTLDQIDIEWKGHNDNFGEEDEEELEYEDMPRFGYPKGHIKTLDQLLEKCDVDMSEWVVERFVVNKWDVTAFKNGYPETWENFQVKATLNKIKEVSDGKKIAKIFEKMSKDYAPPVIDASAMPRKNSGIELGSENNLLEVSLFDLHIGKLGWAGEVGENYDTKIARARFIDAITVLLKRAKGFTYNKILFPIGNDFFNSDNQFNTTTKGTPQDEDVRWQKTFDLGCKLIVDAINILKATGVDVEVPVIPGNHDQERSYYLGSFINAWFRDDPQVTVNNSALTRKYYEWGEVMLGFTHGNEEKENSLPLLMATEQKKMWGRTTFHEWHLGHFHKKRNVKFTIFDKAQVLNEEHSVTVRYLSSLSGTEEWHYKKGYIGTQKAGEAFLWNDKSGLIGHLNFNFTDFDREH